MKCAYPHCRTRASRAFDLLVYCAPHEKQVVKHRAAMADALRRNRPVQVWRSDHISELESATWKQIDDVKIAGELL